MVKSDESPSTGIMKKRTIFRWVCILLIVFYAIWAVYQLITTPNNLELIGDRFFGILLFGFFLFVNKKIDFHWLAFIMVIFAFNLHHAGLYGHVILGIPADNIIHFSTNFAGVLLFYNIFYSSRLFPKAKINNFVLMLIIFFFTTGIAAFGEIIEFVGYSFLGEGEGILAYGIGDFGEWNDLSWDLIANSIGAIAGIIVFNVFRIKKWIKRMK